MDGIPITKPEWDHLAGPYFEEVEARAGRKLTEEEKRLLRKNVLDELVRERLWVADAKRRRFTVTEAEIDARLQRNPYFKTNGKFDPEKFRQFKFSPASNYREIKGQVESAVLLEKYRGWMEARYSPPESELKREFLEKTAQASIRYFWLIPDAVTLGPQASAEQIRAYYERHPDEFQAPEEARITYIRVPIETSGLPSDSLRLEAAARALIEAKALLVSIRSGRSPEALAKKFGGVKESGPFALGDPIRGLGRSDALTEAVRAAQPKQWVKEPIQVGPNYVVARLDEHHAASLRPFREVQGLAKRKADSEIRDAELDSLARLEYAAHPDRYRAPRLTGSVIARGTATFDDPRPISQKEVALTLERLRRAAGVADTARTWADSVVQTLPNLVRRERQLALAFQTMAEVASRLKRGERAEAVAKRFGAAHEPIAIYRGQPPANLMLVEGAFLDSLYRAGAGSVVGPRVLRDSVFVVRVERVDESFQPPFEAARASARSDAELKRIGETEREAETYFASHPGPYRTPPRWSFQYVLFRKAKPESISVPEDSIRVYYEEHPLEFTVPAKARVRHILISYRPGEGAGARAAARKKALEVLRKVKNGGDFAALAREYSDDRGSGAQGGDLGEITRGQVVKEFGDAAFALKPGEISGLVESQFGFHVIRTESLTPQRLRTLEESRGEIRGVLGESLGDSLARGDAFRFWSEASKPGARFEELAKRYGGASTVPPVGIREPAGTLGVIPTLESDIGSLHEGGVSRPIAVGGGYAVAQLTKSHPPRQATFAEVKDQVIRDSQGARRKAAADSIDTRLRAALRSGADLESLLVPLGGLRVSRLFPRHGPIPDLTRDSLLVRDSALYAEIFSSKPGSVLRPRRGSLGTLYAVVDSLVMASPKEFAEHRAELKQELVDERSAAWTERLRSRAKIQFFRRDLKLD